MKKLLPVILITAIVTTVVEMTVWFGLGSSSEQTVSPAPAEKSSSAKGASRSVDCGKLRQETQVLQQRVAELEKQLEDKRRVNEANSKPPKYVSKSVYITDELKRLFVEDPAEYTNLVNRLNNRVAKELKDEHDDFLKKIDFLDSVGQDASSEEELAIHENYRTLLTLEHELDEFLKAEGNRLTIYENTPPPHTHEEGVEEAKAYNAAWNERIEVRKKMSVIDAQERELLVGKVTKAVGLAEDLQDDAVETVKAVLEATSDKPCFEYRYKNGKKYR